MAATSPAGCDSSTPMPSSIARKTPAPPWPRPAGTLPPTRRHSRNWRHSPRPWIWDHEAAGSFARRLVAHPRWRAADSLAMTRKQRRATFIVLGVGVLAVAVLLVAVAL